MAIINGNVLSMADYAMDGTLTKGQRAVALSYVELDSVLSYISVKTENENRFTGMRHTGYTDDNQSMWTPLSSDPVDKKENAEPWAETAYLMNFRTTMNRPTFESKSAKGKAAMFKEQFKIQLEKHKFDLDDKFFNNYHFGATASRNNNANCFLGLRARLAASNRPRYGIPSTMKVNASALELRPGLATDADYQKLFTLLDRLCYYMSGNRNFSNLAIFVPQQLASSVDTSYLTTSNPIWSNDTDKIGRQVRKWNKADWVLGGFRMPVRGVTTGQTEILGATENADGDQSDTGATGLASIFVVSKDMTKFYMNQFRAAEPGPIMDVPGTLDCTSVFYNTYAMIQPSTLAIGQIHNLRIA